MRSRKPISAPSVQKAIAECDRLGRGEFLRRHGFGRARTYFLISDGKQYDSKAILAVAHGYEHPSDGALRYEDNIFGGKDDTAKVLRGLGFHVAGPSS